MSKICAFCGGSTATKHYGSCKEYNNAVGVITDAQESIIDQHKSGIQISDMHMPDYDKRLGPLSSHTSRAYFEVKKLLRDTGVYDPYSKTQRAARTSKRTATMIDKYGVVNNGQLPGMGFGDRNSIPYKKVRYLTESFELYEKEVYRFTKKTVRQFGSDLPKFCEYTGVKFADEEGPVNPNDPRKRTVDHVIPVITCYLNYVPADVAASVTNLKFCIRYANSVKGNSTLESFLPLALKIREVFEDEGYQCKPISSNV